MFTKRITLVLGISLLVLCPVITSAITLPPIHICAFENGKLDTDSVIMYHPEHKGSLYVCGLCQCSTNEAYPPLVFYKSKTPIPDWETWKSQWLASHGCDKVGVAGLGKHPECGNISQISSEYDKTILTPIKDSPEYTKSVTIPSNQGEVVLVDLKTDKVIRTDTVDDLRAAGFAESEIGKVVEQYPWLANRSPSNLWFYFTMTAVGAIVLVLAVAGTLYIRRRRGK